MTRFARIVAGRLQKKNTIVVCGNCKAKNRIPDPPRTDGKYSCQRCKSILVTEKTDKEAVNTLKPSGGLSLTTFVGQEAIKQDLRGRLDTALKYSQPLPHLLFCGPNEFGKATLAKAISEEMEVCIKSSQSSEIDRRTDLAALLTNLDGRDILLIENIETIKPEVLEVLLDAIENLELTVTFADRQRIVKLPLKPFTLIATTSHPSQINKTLRRWMIVYDFSSYSELELGEILVLLGRQLELAISSDAASLLAGNCGSPGDARVLVKRLKNYLSKSPDEQVTIEDATRALISFRYLETDSSSVDLVDKLNKMGGIEFEEFVAKCFRNQGFIAESTAASGDHGIDLLLKKNNQVIAVQCKRWTAPVGESVIRDFLGAMAHAGASIGYIVTSSTFTSKAHSFAQKKPIRLIDLEALWELAKIPTHEFDDSTEADREATATIDFGPLFKR